MDDVIKNCGFPSQKLKDNFYALKISTKEEVEQVIHFIQDKTKTTWSVRHTRNFGKEKSRRLFKRMYSCHLFTRRRKNTQNVKPKKSRNIDCPAQLIVTIRKTREDAHSKISASTKEHTDTMLNDSKFPCLIEFRRDHNHLIESEEALKQRPVGDAVKKEIIELLNKGHSVSSAYQTFFTLKVEQFGDDYAKKMCDRHYFPNKNDVSTIYKMNNMKEKHDVSSTSLPSVLKNLEDILEDYSKKNGTIYRIATVDHNNYTVALCTPMMKRALQQMSDVVFVDSSGCCRDVKEHKLYFFLTQTTVGCLPIGCIITNIKKMEAFDAGVKALLELIHIQPTIILTDEEIFNQNIIQRYFTYSKILLGTYHMLNATWKFLNSYKSEITKYHNRHQFYQSLRNVVYADSENNMNHAKHALQQELENLPKFAEFVEKLYLKIDTWCLLYRQYLVLRGNQPFNYISSEESFRIFRLLKDIPLSRTKLFTVTHLTDFICSSFELFYQNRILEMVNNKLSKVVAERYTLTNNNSNYDVEFIGNHQYTIRKVINQDEHFKIDMITGICTCPLGSSGKNCEHQSIIIEKYKLLKPVLTVEEKSAFYYIATGIVKGKNTFLPEQTDDNDDDYSICSPCNSLSHEEDHNLELETTKNKWISYCNQIIQHLEKDPTKFIPAVNAHLNNVKEYATSVPLLLKGLYAGFPYKAQAASLPPLVPVIRPPPLIKIEKG